jgi:WD40 repeat protein
MSVRKWFLSYNTQDLALMERLEGALRHKDPDAQIFFAPKSLRAGASWLRALDDAIGQATAVVLLVGEKGIGAWQVDEYLEARARRVPVILILLEGQPAPGLPLLRQLHWIVTKDPASEHSVAQVLSAASGEVSQPGELWRHTAPYRGLAAMTEADSDFFFGRANETIEVLKVLAADPERMPILIGNSGVGKSSLAQAGVLACLKRQAWPDDAEGGVWPEPLGNSRRWCCLKLRPGGDPLRALVEPFLKTWQYEVTDPLREKRLKGWIDELLAGNATLSGLLDATDARHEELGQPKPTAFILYVDQGEELYVRGDETARRRFSQLLADGLKDHRLRAFMSLRSDFLGALQNDEALFNLHRQINVPPLRESDLLQVVSRPAQLLNARFESESLPTDLARRAAEDSVQDAGALPLLSYLLDDMWTQMIKQGDGILRLPAKAVELGAVLADRANAFLARHPKSEDQLRRLLTFKLASVRGDGEPTRRRALRNEFSDAEWQLVTELAYDPYRLLSTATPDDGQTYAEIAHEALFRRWDKLREWIATEREFLAWRSQLQEARQQWDDAEVCQRNDALLTGLRLSQAQVWTATRADDLPHLDRLFVERSIARDTEIREKQQRAEQRSNRIVRRSLAVAMLFALVLTAALGIAVQQWQNARTREGQALVAESRVLAASARDLLAVRDYRSALEVALETMPPRRAPHERPVTGQGYNSLLRAVIGYSNNMVLRHDKVDGYIFDAAFSSDSRKLITSTGASAVRVWDLETRRVLHRWDARRELGTPRVVRLVAGSRRAIAAFERSTVIWNLENNETIEAKDEVIADGPSPFSNDQQLLATTNSDSIIIRNVLSGDVLSRLSHKKNFVQAFYFLSTDRGISISKGGRIILWSLLQGSIIDETTIQNSDGVASISPTGRELLVAARGGDIFSVTISESLAVQKLTTLFEVQDKARKIIHSQSGHLAAIQYADNNVVVLVPSGGQLWCTLKGAHLPHSFSADDKVLISTDISSAMTWSLADCNKIHTINERLEGVLHSNSNSNELVYATKNDFKHISLWKQDGTLARRFADHTDMIRDVHFSPDGRWIVSTSNDRTVRLHSIEDKASQYGLMSIGATFSDSLSANVVAAVDHVAIAVASNQVSVWSLSKRQVVATFKTRSHIRSLGIDDTGMRVVVGAEDGGVSIHRADSGELERQIAGYRKPVDFVSISPSGRFVVYAAHSMSSELFVANTITGMAIGPIVMSNEFRSPYVAQIAFDPTEELFAVRWDSDRIDIASLASLATRPGDAKKREDRFGFVRRLVQANFEILEPSESSLHFEGDETVISSDVRTVFSREQMLTQDIAGEIPPGRSIFDLPRWLAADGAIAVRGDWNNDIALVDRKSMKVIRTLYGGSCGKVGTVDYGGVTHAKFIDSGKLLTICGYLLTIWDLQSSSGITFQLEHELQSAPAVLNTHDAHVILMTSQSVQILTIPSSASELMKAACGLHVQPLSIDERDRLALRGNVSELCKSE